MWSAPEPFAPRAPRASSGPIVPLACAGRPAPLGPPVIAYLGALGGEVAREQMFSSMMTFPEANRLRLVQVHAVEGAFPFYGRFETDPAGASGRLRSGGAVAVLEPTLLAQFGVRIGDRVKLGRTLFTVVGALRKVPGESPGVAMMAQIG